uniref:Uncharacterized protein n=1 Tax=Anopheles merus TaxID=30066 RepID=A0A182V0L4_ANOME
MLPLPLSGDTFKLCSVAPEPADMVSFSGSLKLVPILRRNVGAVPLPVPAPPVPPEPAVPFTPSVEPDGPMPQLKSLGYIPISCASSRLICCSWLYFSFSRFSSSCLRSFSCSYFWLAGLLSFPATGVPVVEVLMVLVPTIASFPGGCCWGLPSSAPVACFASITTVPMVAVAVPFAFDVEAIGVVGSCGVAAVC